MARSKTRSRARAIAATLTLAMLLAQLVTMPVSAGTGPSGAAAAAEVVDTTAPTAPGDLHVVSRTKSSAITLGWTASYDEVGVAGYRLYRDGVWKGTLTQAGVDLLGTVWYDRITGRTKGPITYQLYAFDAAGNVSAPATLVVNP